MKTKAIQLSILILSLFIFACQPAKETETESIEVDTLVQGNVVAETPVYDTNDVKSMLAAVELANGGKAALKALKDVEYDYYYMKPDDTRDVSKERYIFNGEFSWARYSIHEVNVSPDLEGNIVQYHDGRNTHAYLEGQRIEDSSIISTSQFLRQANLMWFCMMFKLNDPGTIAQYQGREQYNGKNYDLVRLGYNPKITRKAENDIFILYMDPNNHLVDYFAFSLPAFGVYEPTLWAELTYEEIEGIQVVTHRMMYSSNPETGEMEEMVDQRLSNVRFNNGFTDAILSDEL